MTWVGVIIGIKSFFFPLIFLFMGEREERHRIVYPIYAFAYLTVLALLDYPAILFCFVFFIFYFWLVGKSYNLNLVDKIMV